MHAGTLRYAALATCKAEAIHAARPRVKVFWFFFSKKNKTLTAVLSLPGRRGKGKAVQKAATTVKLAAVVLVIAGVAGVALRFRGTPGGAAPVTSSSGFRAAYLTNGVASCISAAKTTLSGQRVAVPDEKITNYCVCTINKVSDSFTDRQIAAADQASLSGTAMPADLSAKLTAFAQECAVHLH